MTLAYPMSSANRILASGFSCARNHTRIASLSRPRPCRQKICDLQHAQLGRRFFHPSPSSASSKNPYTVLGVSKDASAADIKKSYYALAKKYHPDTNKDKAAHEAFVEIQAAYDLLRDEQKRANYDRYGAASQEMGFDPEAMRRARQNPFAGAGFAGFSELFGARPGGMGGMGGRGANMFEELFGASFSGRAQENARGEDITATVGISFLDAAQGAQRTVSVTSVVECSTCQGSGLKAKAKRSTCPSCGGAGSRRYVLDSGFQMETTCQSCGGAGNVIPKGSQCGSCAGMGRVRVRKTVPVDIPAGIEDGMSIRVPGQGDMPITGKGAKGDLIVRVNVASSRVFRRQGVNLHHEARIPVHLALLGGRVRIPTLNGEIDVNVPTGVQPSEELVLKGYGFPHVYGSSAKEKGDLFVSFAVQIPRSLTKYQRSLLQEYADDVENGGTQSSRKSSDTSGTKETPRESEHLQSTSQNGTKSFLRSLWSSITGKE